MRIGFVVAVAAASLVSAAAVAQRDPLAPIPHNGGFVSATERSVTIRRDDGTTETVAMTSDWTVSVARPGTLSEVRAGNFVASINADIDATSGRARELRVFEPGYRPEYGTHPVGQPGTSITHGTVATVAKAGDDVALEVVYPDGKRTILVSADTKVTIYDVRPRSVLAAGTAVSALTRTAPDGTQVAGRLTLTPPPQ